MTSLNSIAVEAYKKYILVSLIHNGQVCLLLVISFIYLFIFLWSGRNSFSSFPLVMIYVPNFYLGTLDEHITPFPRSYMIEFFMINPYITSIGCWSNFLTLISLFFFLAKVFILLLKLMRDNWCSHSMKSDGYIWYCFSNFNYHFVSINGLHFKLSFVLLWALCHMSTSSLSINLKILWFRFRHSRSIHLWLPREI